MTRPVLVGFDASDNSRAALAWAADYAQRCDAPLVAVHVLGMLERRSGGDVVPAQSHRAEITTWAEELVAAVAAEHGTLAATAVVRDGEPVPTMLDEAERVGAQLIVVGTRGADQSRSPLGTTSSELSATATCSVVIVR